MTKDLGLSLIDGRILPRTRLMHVKEQVRSSLAFPKVNCPIGTCGSAIELESPP